jgi:hypothetical protein
MATSQLELIMAQVRPLNWPDKLRLLQWVVEDLQPSSTATEGKGLVYGEYRNTNRPLSNEADFNLSQPVEDHTPSYASFFGAGRGSFATPEEAEAFLRQERDEWEN